MLISRRRVKLLIYENVIMVFAAICNNKKAIGLSLLFTTLIFVLFTDNSKQPSEEEVLGLVRTAGLIINPRGVAEEKISEWWGLKNDSVNYSQLGKILFLDAPEPEQVTTTDKRYQILVWKYGSAIENRHIKNFSGKKTDPFAHCPVKNCDLTYSDSNLTSADIVIIHLHRTRSTSDIPSERNPNQIWAFLTDESPFNTFLTHKNKLSDFNGVFNWSMAYRSDSDIPVPYGRTVLKKNPDDNPQFILNKRRDVLIAVLGSNCGGQNHRWKYIKELQKHIEVHVYGACGDRKNECPGHFGIDCPAIGQYLFYLSFENSNCDEYITEKLWWNAYGKDSIPIVMGSSVKTYKKLLPVNSYINTEDFANPRALAAYVQLLNQTGDYKKYYDWKANFEVLNEHGYFQSKSFHYCRVCQALNYNTKENKVYSDLGSFWSTSASCHPPYDAWVE